MASDLRRFRPYIRYLKPVRWAFAGAILFGILAGIGNAVALPWLMEKVLPQMFAATAQRVPLWRMALVAALIPGVFIFRNIMGYLNVYLLQYCGTRILELLRLDFFRKLQLLPISFFQGQRNGDLISRGMADTNQLQATMSHLANDLLQQPVTLAAALGYVSYLAFMKEGVMMVLVCLIVVPLCVLPIRYAGKKVVRRASQLQRELGSVTNVMSENLGAAREVRAFGIEARETARFGARTRQLLTYQMKIVKYSKAISPGIEIISSFGIAMTLIYAYHVRLGWETFMAILALLYACYGPIKKLGELSNNMKRGLASLDRIEEVLNEPVTITDPARPVNIGRLRGDLAFGHVTFAYGTEPVLADVTITLPAGTVCALVGPSGAGKSTFANLVPRFFDPGAGRVTIDGIDIRDMRLADLRGNIALVSQEAILFNDTIYENLLLSRPGATRAEVEQAARDAYAHEFILTLPNGYETIVGERGASLSGGQRQRVALARAFLRNAPILILDEATSALDSESEAMIRKSLTKLVRGKTVLMIAHRFSTIRDATMILLFNEGRIVARGPHAELYASSPLYRGLYDQQNTGAMPPG